MNANLDFLSGHEVVVYHTSWCPDCKRLERWLVDSGLNPGQVNIEDDEAASAKLVEETGKRAVPFLLVDGQTWVRGYHKERPMRFDPALLVQELREATGEG